MGINESLDKFNEACGVVGIIDSQSFALENIYKALLTLQHRGQESSGILAFNSDSHFYTRQMGLVNELLKDNILSDSRYSLGIGHTRYSTTGNSSLDNAQPILLSSSSGMIGLAHNGNLVNTADLRDKLTRKGLSIKGDSDSELIGLLICSNIDSGSSVEEAVVVALSECVGAFSLVIATNDKLIAARDLHGIRPLSLGRASNGRYVVASETCTLDTLEAQYIRDINPGEVLVIDLNGTINSFKYTDNTENKLCIFEIIYFSRPDSIVYGSTVYNYRLKLGVELARSDSIKADIVIGIPDSGTASAIGYSYESKIPFAQGFIRNYDIGRTFIEPSLDKRARSIEMKLNPIKDVISGKKVIVVDDSIVRGNTSRNITALLRQAGAKEVHFRVSSSIIKHPCFFGIDTDTYKQLIAAQMNLEELNQFLDTDSLMYLSYDDMVKVCCTDNSKDYCAGCFSGVYPVKYCRHAILAK